MNNLLHVSSSPHVRCKDTTQNLMLDVVIAMLPAAAFGVYRFGVYALVVILATVAACVASEYIWQKLMHKPITVNDCSAVVTGMILALNMPPEIPVWIPMLGGVFAIIVVKQLYGGLGQNFMNPALAARCFLLISFAGLMNDFSSAAIGFDSLTGATPLASMRAGSGADLSALFLGLIPGTIGEVSTLALLIGGVYMIVKKVISPKIPLTFTSEPSRCLFSFSAALTYLLHLKPGLRRRPGIRGLLYGDRLRDQPHHPQRPGGLRRDSGPADGRFPSVGSFPGGSVLRNHL